MSDLPVASTPEVQPESNSIPEAPETSDRDRVLAAYEGNSTTPPKSSPEGSPEEPQESYDYTKDKRWGTHWKTVEDIYRSQRELEGKFGQTSNEYSQAKKQLEELNQYKQEVEPYSDALKLIQVMQGDPKLSPLLERFVSEVNQTVKQERFGDLPDEVISQLLEVNELKRWKQEFEMKQQQDQMIDRYNQELNRIREYSKENGIEYNEQEFMNYLNGLDVLVPPEHLYDKFRSNIMDKVVDSRIQIALEEFRTNLNSNRNASTPFTSRNTPSSGTSGSLREQVAAAYEKPPGA